VIWLSPLALIGVAAVAAPILIHILVQRRAERFAFPTLRFLQPTRLAAIRRHVLEDLPLLAVRAAIIAGAAVALAGPLLVTPARRAAWHARVARAVVVQGGPERAALRPLAATSPSEAQQPPPSAAAIAAQTTIDTSDLRDGIARAIAWLDAAPPATRELLIVSTFALGSITRADLHDVPPDVGIRFERSGRPPATQSFAATPVLVADLESRGVRQHDRTIDLDGATTSVRESPATPAAVPIEIVGAADIKAAADATLAAVLSRRVPAPAAGRGARVILATALPADMSPSTSLSPWIAGAIARIGTNGDLANAGGGGLPPIALSTDGALLIVTTTLPPGDLRTALLFRSIFDALSADEDGGAADPILGRRAKALAEREVLTIPDADLRAWERPAGDARPPSVKTIDRDDRRWWWAAVLVLLALETVMRRSRPAQPAEQEFSNVA
jgi:hypothetical protein